MSPLNNSRGSITILIILGLILISSATIIGGAFYVSKHFNPTKITTNSTEDIKISSSSAVTKNLDQAQAAKSPSPTSSTLTGKIYYLSQVQAETSLLKTVSPNINNSQPLTGFNSLLKKKERINSFVVSPDKSVTLIKTRIPFEDHARYDVKSNDGESYYLLSKSGDIKKMDFDKIVTPFVKSGVHRYGRFIIDGFSVDGKKLVGSISLTSLSGENEGFVMDYDLATGQVKELFRPEGVFKAYFYDSDKQLLAYQTTKPKEEQSDDLFNNKVGKLINLQDKATTDFNDPAGNLPANSQYTLTDFISGNPYFVITNKNPTFVPNGTEIGVTGHYEYTGRHSLWINSFYNPTNKGFEVKLDSDDLSYGRQVLWSPDFNYFAIAVQSNSSEKKDNYNYIYIYSRLGEFVAKAETDADDFFNYGYFSPDNRYLLINPPIGSWKIFDTKEQKFIQNKSGPSGIALYWEP